MSTISVIIPTYNRAHLIRETLDSLMAQTRRPDQVLVIDDGSTDGTPGALDRYDGLTVVRTENSRRAGARCVNPPRDAAAQRG